MEQMQSEQINELATAMAKMQGDLESAAKSSENPFFKNKYADLATVWDVCRLPMSKNGLALIQQISIINEKSVLVTTLTHSSGQWMRSICPIITSKQDAQGMGAGITYMRRYAMCAMLGITQDDDDGNAASGISNKAVSEKQLNEVIVQLVSEFPEDKQEVAGEYLSFCKSHYKSKKGTKWLEMLLSELNNSFNDLDAFRQSVYTWNVKRLLQKQ